MNEDTAEYKDKNSDVIITNTGDYNLKSNNHNANIIKMGCVDNKSMNENSNIKTTNKQDLLNNDDSENHNKVDTRHIPDKTIKNPINTTISIETTSIYSGDEVIIYLKDTNGTPITNAELDLLINNNNYNKITDINGAVNIGLNLPANEYLLTAKYLGNETYAPSNVTFNIIINKKQSNILIQNNYVVKGKELVIRLVDNKGQAINNKIITISLFNKNYSVTSDNDGFARLKINLNTKKYRVKVNFEGDDNYCPSQNSFEISVYKLKTNFKVSRIWVVRGTHFIAYLKDKYGNPLSNAIVKIRFKKKIITKKTNNKGRISLKINNKLGKYLIRLRYGGDNSHIKTSKKLKIHIYRAKTKIITGESLVVKGKYLSIYLKDKSNRPVAHGKLIIKFSKKIYRRTTNGDGRVLLKLNKIIGTYKIKVSFRGTKGYVKTSRYVKATIIKNENVIDDKALKLYLNGNTYVSYAMKFLDSNGNPLVNQTVKIKTKCNDFTIGTGRKITKKTIVLSSDNIYNKARDKRLLKNMAKLLRAKGYRVIVSGIGPNYHVTDVKKYKNVCVFSLVGGIDSGMFVDMAQSYYQKYLRKNKNQFVLGCVRSPSGVNLANRFWLERAHDDNYSPDTFTGLYFPGKYLNKNTHVDYVYGTTANALVNNFLNYARKGKSIGMYNTIPGAYTTKEIVTNNEGYVYIDLHIGTHTIISSFNNPITNAVVDATEYVKVML